MTDSKEEVLSITEQSRRNLVEWKHGNFSFSKNHWYKGSTYRRLVDKTTLNNEGMDAIAEGWLPAQPLINPDTRVLAIGSCFARYFILWLAEHGFNKSTPTSPYNALIRFGSDFESAAAIAQQFRWAFNELDDKTLLWIDKQKAIFEASEERRELVKESLLTTDVVLLTLGLSEVWYDQIAKEPLWRALTTDQFNPNRHIFHVESMNKTLHWLETIERLRSTHTPNLKIIFTISPVRLTGTFRSISAFTANSASKAILRAALDEFLRNHQKELNSHLFYFPSYEFVTDYFLDPFEHDNRHVTPSIAASIIHFFVRHYCSTEIIECSGQSLSNLDAGEHLEQFISQSRITSIETQSGELLARLSELENKVVKLQKVCDERQEVIVELDQAARERLNLIQQLDAEVKRLQKTV